MERSSELYARAKDLMPGGVNSPIRACLSVECEPLFIKKGEGATLTTEDGKTYIDFVEGWGPMLLGHAHPDVTKAIQESAANGCCFGAPYAGEVELAQMIVDAMPGIDMVRMVSSGTEATMTALRLARGYTGRDKFVKFIGNYHGHGDPFLAAAGSGFADLAIPGTPGVPAGTVQDTLLVPFNDLEAVRKQFEANGDEISCIIVEPMAGNMGVIPPAEGFLQGLRDVCDQYGALLIFDEVITGFRLSYGGAQKRFGVTPDLTTLGKIIGGGMPVGAYGGKREIMDRVAPTGNIFQAGTNSGNPVVMAAGIATLKVLQNADYDALEARVAAFAKELHAILASKGVDVTYNTIASMFTMFFTNEKVTHFEHSKACNAKVYASFYQQMRAQGIYLASLGLEAAMVSFAHTDEQLEKALEAARNVKF
ncbi:MAG: glutamate-1-semialdehyde 2,1-aminomutase [Halodesulfovibrio sp.]|uniref:glutamate-1-semialdehyde 2,1-aminomutase n=1 Tax=Halodesulfovibrio sp. TaxID=1912772 RepID=UPI00359E59D6